MAVQISFPDVSFEDIKRENVSIVLGGIFPIGSLYYRLPGEAMAEKASNYSRKIFLLPEAKSVLPFFHVRHVGKFQATPTSPWLPDWL